MRKLLFITMLIVGFSTASLAQSKAKPTPQGGAASQLNFGGLGTGLYCSYDFTVAKDITVSPIGKTNWNFDWLVIGVKGDYYFDTLLKLPAAWDVYAGANAGFSLINEVHNNGDFDFGIQIGGRWWFSEKWAINGEFGGGRVVTGGVGVSMRM